ncbi:MAG: hypothetical protein IJ466_04355 [Clostridia bacterium]|nr:hypothetical protein [Clostridia bacterium]
MENKAGFCTCNSLDCPHHPSNHDKGCTPCIEKNLRMREIPGCFFRKVEGHESCTSYYFEDFARLVLEK